MNTEYKLSKSQFDTLMIETDNSKYVSMSAWHLVMGNMQPELCADVESIEDDYLVLYNLVF